MPKPSKSQKVSPERAVAALTAPKPRAAGSGAGTTARRSRVEAQTEPRQENAAADLIRLHEQIARLAYSYWEERGGQGGDPEEDWLRAEREILSH